MKPVRLLIVDDDDVDRDKLRRLLNTPVLPTEIFEAASGREAIDHLRQMDFDCVLLDYFLGDTIGTDLLPEIEASSQLPCPVIMITGQGNERGAVEAMRNGVFDYLPKRDLKRELLLSSIEGGLRWAELQTQFRENKETLAQIVDGSPVATFVIDREHKLTHWNRACEVLTGMAADRIIGTCDQWRAFYAEERPVLADIVLDGADDAAVDAFYHGKYRRSTLIDGAFEVEDFLPRLGTAGRWVFFTASPLRDSNGHIIGAIETLQDVTKRKQAESSLRRTLNRLQALHELDCAIAEARSPQAVAAKGLQHLVRLISCWGATVMTFDHAARTATVLAIERAAGSVYDRGMSVSLQSYGLQDLAVLKNGELCRIADLAALPERSPVLERMYQQGVRSYVRIPLRVEGELLGALNLAADESAFFTDEHVDVARPIAEVLGIALQQALLRQRLEQQAAELEQRVQVRTAELALMKERAEAANVAKSQFLANMSHELRTPLNSLLILSQMLADNVQGNLTQKQVEFARTIFGSGSDLLNLINDILDLAKIEAGRVMVEIEALPFAALGAYVARTLSHVAEGKGLSFRLALHPDLPAAIHTDSVRLQQVLRNLLANAIKFTPEGSVTLDIQPAPSGWHETHRILGTAESVIAFRVSDTGIGIEPDKQELIFEAFQQAEAGTARNYGGTGLGLSISRENANLLGGELSLQSSPGAGSTFTLFLPLAYCGSADGLPPGHTVESVGARAPAEEQTEFSDDRVRIHPGDTVLLAIEDDLRRAGVLMELARDKGMKMLVARSGSQGLALARQYRPTAIALDLMLPDADGWSIFERLRLDPATANIPVMLTSVRDDTWHALEAGALAVLAEPVTRTALDRALEKLMVGTQGPLRRLLVVDANAVERTAMVAMLRGDDVVVAEAASGEQAIEALAAEDFDCMVLDLMLPGMSGFDLLERLRAHERMRHLPVVVHPARDLSGAQHEVLRGAAQGVAIKQAHSDERLLAETCRFLDGSLARQQASPRKLLVKKSEIDKPLAGCKVLLVDDDIRNLFALAALLESHHMVVLTAESGAEALQTLARNPGVQAAIVDIMMPQMDGYAVTQAIRLQPAQAGLPIIALTAKTMKGDREACLAAGCSDYLPKPVDRERLIAMLLDLLNR